jgi:hypothetical protein
MRFESRGCVGFSRLEAGVVLVALVLFILVLIPAFLPPKPLQLAPEIPQPPPTPPEAVFPADE